MPTFSVRLEPQGRTIVADAARPVLEAALAAGINLPHSCKSGHCSSCRARLLGGEIEYPQGRRPAGLTEAEAAAGRVLLCQARPRSDLVIEARTVFRAGSGVVAAGRDEFEIRRLPCRIDEKRLLAPDVMQLWLRLPAVEPLPFHAGQYLDILLEGGRRRSFSIASPPHDAARLELHVRRAPGSGFTAALFDAMPPGTLLRIEGPIGQFVYEPGEAPLLLVAGGTGFAPLKSMLRHVLEVERTSRPVRLYWGARTTADVYEAALLREWCARHSRLRCVAVLSDSGALGEAPPEATLQWRAGWVHEVAAAELGATLATHDVYVAGPPALVEAVRADYPARGVPPERIRFDSFDYAPR